MQLILACTLQHPLSKGAPVQYTNSKKIKTQTDQAHNSYHENATFQPKKYSSSCTEDLWITSRVSHYTGPKQAAENSKQNEHMRNTK
jgi:hypothetical protein